MVSLRYYLAPDTAPLLKLKSGVYRAALLVHAAAALSCPRSRPPAVRSWMQSAWPDATGSARSTVPRGRRASGMAAPCAAGPSGVGAVTHAHELPVPRAHGEFDYFRPVRIRRAEKAYRNAAGSGGGAEGQRGGEDGGREEFSSVHKSSSTNVLLGRIRRPPDDDQPKQVNQPAGRADLRIRSAHRREKYARDHHAQGGGEAADVVGDTAASRAHAGGK